MPAQKRKGTKAQPGYTIVPLINGTKNGKVRSWTMAQRADLKPLIESLLDRVANLNNSGEEEGVLPLGRLFLEAEDDLMEIAQQSIELPPGTGFDDLLWEDLPNIIQGVWSQNLVSPDGSGIGGKVMSVLAETMVGALATNSSQNQSETGDLSTGKSTSSDSSKDSPSSLDAGEVPPTASATH